MTASVAIMEALSEHDKEVVKTILDPFQLSADTSQDPDTSDPEKKEHLDADVLDFVKKAIACAETQNFDECLQFFDKALKRAPKSPSVLNDRAQALRLAGRVDEALKDLDLAVTLSEGKGRAGVQALCQRGILYRCMNKDVKAKEDFQRAAKGGSDFALTQLVALDPYATMGNAVFAEMARKSGYDINK